MLEIDMVKDCYQYVEHLPEYKKAVCEIPFFARCIDMVLVSSGDELVTIEFKLKNWREAIQQALDHKKGTDYAYICLPQRTPSEKLISALNEAGVGLLLYHADAECKLEEFIPAPKNDGAIPYFHQSLQQLTYSIAK